MIRSRSNLMHEILNNSPRICSVNISSKVDYYSVPSKKRREKSEATKNSFFILWPNILMFIVKTQHERKTTIDIETATKYHAFNGAILTSFFVARHCFCLFVMRYAYDEFDSAQIGSSVEFGFTWNFI